MRYLKTQVLAGVIAFFSLSAQARVTVPGDVPYYRFSQNDVQYIYDSDTAEAAAQLTAYQEMFRRMYDKSYGWRLTERQDLILLSGRQQVGNAYATIIPNIKSVWFPAGADFLESTATSSWMLTLASHETAHLYQLNAKSEFPRTLESVLGNSVYAFFFVVPVWLSPNIWTPTFLVEGNAVLQESRLNRGGRLHSGESRALVLAQIQAGQIDPNRLINDQFRFPFGSNPYLQGAYFQAHLASKHGLEKTNQFFKTQGEHWLWPWVLNNTFRKHFGASYPQEIREYVRGMEALAKKQKFTPGVPLVSAIQVGNFNHDADRIWFLSSDGVDHPFLRIYDKKSKSFSARQYNLSVGKVFFDGAKPLVSDSQQNDLHHITYSLYGEHSIMDERYQNLIVTDQRAGKTAALDARNAWLDARVMVNGEPYDIGHSNPVLDEAGNIYYFRQNGAQRVLYKNREPVFKYDGFYGKVTEAQNDGTIYFIGSTDYGSTLYRYKNKELSRVLASDRVVDARVINDKEFLVSEVGADGYSVHVVGSEVKSASPAIYSYGFTVENVNPEKSMATEQLQADHKPYNSLSTLRFSSLDVITTFSSDPGLRASMFGGAALFNFTDPLEYNAFHLGYAGEQHRDQLVLLNYEYTKYLADIIFSYRYKEEWWQREDGADQKAFNQDVALGVGLPLLRHGLWDAAITTALTYELEDAHNDPNSPSLLSSHPSDNEEFYGVRSSFLLTRTDQPPIAMFARRGFLLKYSNHLQTNANEWSKKHNTSLVNLNYEHGLPNEFYVSGFGTMAWAESKDIDVDSGSDPTQMDTQVATLRSDREYTVKTAGSLRLEVHKVFNLRGYSPRIFVGLDRIAPFVAGQATALDDDVNNKYPLNIYEYGYGADLQILLFHRIHAIQRVMLGYDSNDPDKPEARMTFTIKQNF